MIVSDKTGEDKKKKGVKLGYERIRGKCNEEIGVSRTLIRRE
jgi:hypothetical protein